MLYDVTPPAFTRFEQGRKNGECSRNSVNFTKAGLELHILLRRKHDCIWQFDAYSNTSAPPPLTKCMCVCVCVWKLTNTLNPGKGNGKKYQTLLTQLKMNSKIL